MSQPGTNEVSWQTGGLAPLTPGQSGRNWSQRTFSRVEAGSVRGSVFSLCCSAIGMGVLVLPYTMSEVGPLVALLMLISAAAAGYMSLRICCAGAQATNTHSYVSTLTVMFSESVAATLTFLLVVACFGLCCGYFVFSSQLLKQLLEVAEAPSFFRQRSLIIAASACFPVLPLSFFRNLSDFRYLTLISLGGLTYLSLLVVCRTQHYLPGNGLQSDALWRINNAAALPKCFGLCFTAYVVHMNVFAAYEELKHPTPRRINKVLFRTSMVQTVLYVSLSVCGFLSFGSETPDNILQAYDLEDTWANVGRIFVCLQLLLAVPLTVHPGRSYLWPMLCITFGIRPQEDAVSAGSNESAVELGPGQKEGRSTAQSSAAAEEGLHVPAVNAGIENSERRSEIPEMSKHMYSLITVSFVVLSGIVAAKVESASDLLGVVGGFSAVTYAYLMPAEMASKLRQNRERFSIDLTTTPAAFIFGWPGPFIIAGLRACTVVGYMAAAQCAWNMFQSRH
eukprot:TRINITY_DN15825_c0_g1_i1.p1 TRINITY_DN15825_c0_g1~~TRINITY_DN15825_c0_g1_i1.p1  ORF type:complete len:528 (+),score=69.11 TRINITY_DN15825_c0_g1_i1:66-1586(+)